MQTYTIDPERTTLTFGVRRLLRVGGAFTRVAGTVTTDNADAPRSLEVSIAAASLSTGLARRDEHLRSGDFLAAERNPLIAYSSQSIEQGAPGHYTIHGILRMNGREHAVTLAALNTGIEPDGAQRVHVSGRVAPAAFGIPHHPVTHAIVSALVGSAVAVNAAVCVVPVRASVAATPISGNRSDE